MTTTGSPTDGTWRRSTRCDGSSGNCVEVKSAGGAIAVRDGKDPEGPVLVYPADEWDAFIGGVKAGEFDRHVL